MVDTGRRHKARTFLKEHPFFPNHVLRMAVVICGALALVMVLSAVYPAPVGWVAAPGQGQETAVVPWILEPVRILHLLLPGPTLPMAALLLAALFVTGLPFIDRYGDVRRIRRAVARAGFLVLALLTALAFLFRLLGAMP